MANRNLHRAKRAKNDEFYTQWHDIESEMIAYTDFDPDVFRDKTILLPCDDPEWSNFTRFFAQRFHEFGLRRLVSTSYAPSHHYREPTEFETGHPDYTPERSSTRGRLLVLDREDVNEDVRIDLDDLQWTYLDGDGDFRSPEVTALRDEADMVITNPPFSLFREFIAWLIDGDVEFAAIGNINAITYKEVFPFIQADRLWKGATGNTSDMVFGVPKGTPIRDSDREKADRLGYPDDSEFDYTRMGNTCWFTNIDHGRRHEPLQLVSMEENLRYSRNRTIREHGYREYDDFDGIEVPAVVAIPSDYPGVMGVPITFLDKYCPEQFEILGLDHPDPDVWVGHGPSVDGKVKYRRIVIRHRAPVVSGG